jgi:hypothetical protein
MGTEFVGGGGGDSVMKANLCVGISFSGGVVESAMGKNSVCNSVEFGRIVRFISRRGICSMCLLCALRVRRVLVRICTCDFPWLLKKAQ